MKNIKRAFTLAEVLTTLMVIGIVAALTIPSMMNSYKKHTYVVGLKKFYSNLSQAAKMIPISQGCPAGDLECVGWNSMSREARMDLLMKQFKNARALTEQQMREYCGEGRIGNCTGVFPDYLADGPIAISSVNEDYFGGFLIDVDINAQNGPNIDGRDTFRFYIANITRNGVPAGTVLPHASALHAEFVGAPHWYWRKNSSLPGLYCYTANQKESEACTGRVLEEGKMNY